MQITDQSAEQFEDGVRAYLASNDLPALRNLLIGQRAPDIADMLDRLDERQRVEVFQLLPPELAAEVLAETGSDTTRDLITNLPSQQVAQMLDDLPMDEVAELLSEDVPQETEALLEQMSPADAQEVRTLLQYPANSAGRLMTQDFIRVAPTATSSQIIEHIRVVGRDVEFLTDIYVVEMDGTLAGVASLRQVVIAPPDQPVHEYMATAVVSAAPADDQEAAARLIAHYNFLALPVVEDRRILGIITVDDAIDVLIEEDTEDRLHFGGVEPGVIDQPYFTTPIWTVVRSRVVWLLLLFVAESFTGSVLRIFEDELARVVALSFFIPLLIGTGGNTGAQTVSTITRGLALKEIRFRDAPKVVGRELFSGVLLGVGLGIVGFGRAMLWDSGIELSLVVALTLVVICTWSNTIGALIPLVAQRLKIDPALVSAPLITTLVDATGLAIYLLIARALLTALQGT